jgi:tubulin monoglycylase TTLL3/8
MKKAVKEHFKEHKLGKDTKLFVIIGHYDDLRQEMLRRGWVEHESHATGVKTASDKFKSNAFHFLYSTKAKDIFRIPNLAGSQNINHFEGTKALTTKVGLTHNMKNLIWRHTIDIDAFFPQSYDLSDLKGDELKDFQEDFRYCQTIAFLK